MSIGYAFVAYLLPIAIICGAFLVMRECSYANMLEAIALWLRKEAARSRLRHREQEQELRKLHAGFQSN